MKKRTQLTTFGRVVVIATMLTAGAVAGAAGANAMRSGDRAHRCVVVQAGDTLWDLAVSVAPDEDPRSTVEQIVRRNGLNGSQIVPGVALWVPWDGSGYVPDEVLCGSAPLS